MSDINTIIPGLATPSLKLACSNCNMRELCMPVGLPSSVLNKLDELVYIRKRLKAGSTLYHMGDPFHSLYAIRSGFIKLETLNDVGREQVTGFYMMGEIFGFDGIATDEHMCTSVVLEDTEVCVIPFDKLEHIGNEVAPVHHHFYTLMSREIVRDHTVMMLLGNMHGEEKVAAFILNLSQRFHERGYSAYELVIRMKREEIGSYLGMKVETISRVLTRFREQGLLEVHQKHIHILNIEGLKNLIDHHQCR